MEHLRVEDKRRYLRYELVDYAIAFGTNYASGVRCVIADVGLGGLSLRCKESLQGGDKLKIVVGRANGEPLSLKGLVRHTEPIPESELHGVGVQFLPENHEERLAIAQYVNEAFQRQCDSVN